MLMSDLFYSFSPSLVSTVTWQIKVRQKQGKTLTLSSTHLVKETGWAVRERRASMTALQFS